MTRLGSSYVPGILLITWLLGGCTGLMPSPPPDGLPPSASDLQLLEQVHLCDSKSSFFAKWPTQPLKHNAWGDGETINVRARQGTPASDQFFFFSEDDILVGAAFRFPGGLDLSPYPVLRRTLSQLKPTLEFYLNSRSFLQGESLNTATLYRTGDKTSTTRYITLKGREGPILLASSIALDPYEPLLARFQHTLLPELEKSVRPSGKDRQPSSGTTELLAIQQFARGEGALFASCGTRESDTAVAAYTKAISYGFPDPVRQSEAHHRLGLALRDKGRLADAQTQFEEALAIRPNIPEIINNLGTVLAEQGKKVKAIASFEKAIILKANYARARFNLAEMLEEVNPRRALEEYETYIALAEGFPDEAARMALAQERIKRLKGP